MSHGNPFLEAAARASARAEVGSLFESLMNELNVVGDAPPTKHEARGSVERLYAACYPEMEAVDWGQQTAAEKTRFLKSLVGWLQEVHNPGRGRLTFDQAVSSSLVAANAEDAIEGGDIVDDILTYQLKLRGLIELLEVELAEQSSLRSVRKSVQGFLIFGQLVALGAAIWAVVTNAQAQPGERSEADGVEGVAEMAILALAIISMVLYVRQTAAAHRTQAALERYKRNVIGLKPEQARWTHGLWCGAISLSLLGIGLGALTYFLRSLESAAPSDSSEHLILSAGAVAALVAGGVAVIWASGLGYLSCSAASNRQNPSGYPQTVPSGVELGSGVDRRPLLGDGSSSEEGRQPTGAAAAAAGSYSMPFHGTPDARAVLVVGDPEEKPGASPS